MPLSEAKRAELEAAALKAGADPDAVIAAGEKIQAERDRDSSPGEEPGAKGEMPKVFQYHLPFIRVVELRGYLGLTDRIDDDEKLCGEFLELHGGALTGRPQSSPPAAGEPTE